jgi:MoaA/NifB/PqqE/SkfB family radical SAM enzyme
LKNTIYKKEDVLFINSASCHPKKEFLFMTYKFNRTSIGFLNNIFLNILKTRYSGKSFLRPVLPSFFATLRCDLKCSYCGLVKKQIKELPTDQTHRLLEKIRPQNQALSITGGEPLVRSDIIDILKKVKELKFAPLFFNTNATLLHEKEECLKYVDYLLISLDSLDQNKWNKILGANGVSKTIIDNIKQCSQLQKKYGFRIIISSVITHETIDDIYEVIDFCERHNIFISPVPEDDCAKAHANLINNEKYYRLIRDIIEMKRKGKNHIVVSNIFLNQILKFPEHNCIPTLVPRIYPDGSVFYPCSPLEKIYGNLLDYPNLNTLLKEAHRKQGLPVCAYNTKKCFMSCFMEPTNMIERPIRLAYEYLKNLR